ncbi:MAG: hypothetical protein WDO18_12585 [Acidobacteriota bacterium]
MMVTVSSAGTPETVAANCALDCPLCTVTEAGTLTLPLLSDNPTDVFEPAADDKLTVHVALPLALKLLGLQLTPLSAAGATKVTCDVRFTPFSVAVTVAVLPVVIVPAVAVKVVLAVPFRFTLPGTDS